MLPNAALNNVHYTTMANIIETIFKKNELVASTLSTSQHDIIDALIICLKRNFNPTTILSSEAVLEVRNLTTFDFVNQSIVDIYEQMCLLHDAYCDEESFQSSLVKKIQALNSMLNLTVSKEFDIPTNVVCKHFSAGDNLSENYPFANSGNVIICDNDNISGIYCSFPMNQTVCPFYVADYGLYFSLTFKADGKDYQYDVIRYRNILGYVCFDLYDQDKNTIANLSYHCANYSDIDKDLLQLDIKSVLTDVHSKIHNSSDFEVFMNIPEDQNSVSKEPAQSYISALVS